MMRLFFVSTMYEGNLEEYRNNKNFHKTASYDDHIEHLIKNTTEFVGSYSRTFRRLGHHTGCTIANFTELQEKWKKENNLIHADNKQIIYEQIRQFSPDILWIDNINYIEHDLISKIRREIKSIRLILCYHCAPFPPGLVNRLRLMDVVITCTPGMKNYIESFGCNVYLVYHGFDSDILQRIKTNNSNTTITNLAFTGSLTTGPGFHQARIQMIEEIIRSGINITLHANLEEQYRITAKQILYYTNKLLKKSGLEKIASEIRILNYGSEYVRNYSSALRKRAEKPVFGYEMFNLLKNSAVTLNYHGDIAGKYAGNMRIFEATGMGSCLLTDNKDNIRDLFFPGTEIMVYDNVDECIDKARWLLENEEDRKKIALAGQKKTLSSHTVEHRCIQIAGILEQEISE